MMRALLASFVRGVLLSALYIVGIVGLATWLVGA